jgi:hypothetical protein
LQRARIDALAVERGAVAAGPVDLRLGADFQQQSELLTEAGIIVFEVETEERVSVDEGAAPRDDFGAALGNEVKGSEGSENAHGIVGADHGDGAGEADFFGERGRCAEDDGGGRVEEIVPVVFADAEDVQAAPVGKGDLFEQMLKALERRGDDAGERIWADGDKTINAELHRGKESEKAGARSAIY